MVGIFGVLISNFIGMVIGLIAGYFGGKTDQVVMRLVDTWMAIPGIFFMLMFVAVMRAAGIQGLMPVIISYWVNHVAYVHTDGQGRGLKSKAT